MDIRGTTGLPDPLQKRQHSRQARKVHQNLGPRKQEAADSCRDSPFGKSLPPAPVQGDPRVRRKLRDHADRDSAGLRPGHFSLPGLLQEFPADFRVALRVTGKPHPLEGAPLQHPGLDHVETVFQRSRRFGIARQDQHFPNLRFVMQPPNHLRQLPRVAVAPGRQMRHGPMPPLPYTPAILHEFLDRLPTQMCDENVPGSRQSRKTLAFALEVVTGDFEAGLQDSDHLCEMGRVKNPLYFTGMKIRLLTACLSAAGLFLTYTTTANAMDLALDDPLTQGSLVRGQVAPGQTVTLDGRAIATTGDGHFVVGFGREHPPHATLRVSGQDSVFERTLAIEAREYQTQHIEGLPRKMVTPDPDDLARIRRDQAEVKAARAAQSSRLDFLQPFRWPVVGIITGVYGSRRILNGEPRNPHYGIDIAAPAGTPVRAPAPGQVTLAHPDMYYTGATLILDHGFGVSSTFLHLQGIDVAVGQTVAAGEQIGRVGSSGRSTGPHLDWRMNWFEVRVDPALLAGPMPATPDGEEAK